MAEPLDKAMTSEFAQLDSAAAWERIHRRILFAGGSEEEHWMHGEIERLRSLLATVEATKNVRATSHSGDVHVMPAFGRPHETSSECWCSPRADGSGIAGDGSNIVWIHEVSN